MPRRTDVLASFAAAVALIGVGLVIRCLAPEDSAIGVVWMGACLACDLWIAWLTVRTARRC